MDKKNLKSVASLIGESYAELASDNLNSISNKLANLINHRQLPEEGWSDIEIESLLLEISKMDTNNYSNKVGVGEREGRIVS